MQSGSEEVHTTDGIECDGTKGGITWHDILEVSTNNSLSVDVLSNNKKIGTVELDTDIIRSACHTTDPTLLKVREFKADDDEEDVEESEDASRKKKRNVVCLLDLAMQVIDSDKTFSTSISFQTKRSGAEQRHRPWPTRPLKAVGETMITKLNSGTCWRSRTWR